MATTLRLISTNLYNGRASPAALRRLLRSELPHVVAPQELAPNAARVIAAELPRGMLDPRLDHHGGGLALRHAADVERFPLEHRDGHRAVLLPGDWPGLETPLEIIAVHLMSPVVTPIRRSIEIRRKQLEQILAHVRRERGPRILLGDFNATPLWPAYRRLAAVLQDAARAVDTPQRTWAPAWWMPRLLRIDHAFVEGAVPVAVKTRRIRGADHSALVVDVSVGG